MYSEVQTPPSLFTQPDKPGMSLAAVLLVLQPSHKIPNLCLGCKAAPVPSVRTRRSPAHLRFQSRAPPVLPKNTAGSELAGNYQKLIQELFHSYRVIKAHFKHSPQEQISKCFTLPCFLLHICSHLANSHCINEQDLYLPCGCA